MAGNVRNWKLLILVLYFIVQIEFSLSEDLTGNYDMAIRENLGGVIDIFARGLCKKLILALLKKMFPALLRKLFPMLDMAFAAYAAYELIMQIYQHYG